MRLVLSAKDYIEQQGDADIVIFHSTVKGFYEQAGFERMDDLVTFVGDPQNPRRSGETGFMLFLSEKGKRGRADFAKGPLFFGDYTW